MCTGGGPQCKILVEEKISPKQISALQLYSREPHWEGKYRFSLKKRGTKLFLCERTFQDRDFFPFLEKGVLSFPTLAPKGVHEKNENGLKTPLSLHFL